MSSYFLRIYEESIDKIESIGFSIVREEIDRSVFTTKPIFRSRKGKLDLQDSTEAHPVKNMKDLPSLPFPYKRRHSQMHELM